MVRNYWIKYEFYQVQLAQPNGLPLSRTRSAAERVGCSGGLCRQSLLIMLPLWTTIRLGNILALEVKLLYLHKRSGTDVYGLRQNRAP